jgi:hypothetical protein
MTPHTLRGSLWDYIPLVTQNVFHFARLAEDQDSVPALILTADLPELLFVINHDIKTREGAVTCRRYFPTEIESLTRKVASLIDQGLLPVYLRDTRMRVDEDTTEHETDVFLVRLDDVAQICAENGIAVSYDTQHNSAPLERTELTSSTQPRSIVNDLAPQNQSWPGLELADPLLGNDYAELIWEDEDIAYPQDIKERGAREYVTSSVELEILGPVTTQNVQSVSHVEFSSRGGRASHKEDYAMRQDICNWCTGNRKNYHSRAAAARDAVNLVPAKLRAVEGWIKEWEIQNPGWQLR